MDTIGERKLLVVHDMGVLAAADSHASRSVTVTITGRRLSRSLFPATLFQIFLQ
jgi:hypothetical protein